MIDASDFRTLERNLDNINDKLRHVEAVTGQLYDKISNDIMDVRRDIKDIEKSRKKEMYSLQM